MQTALISSQELNDLPRDRTALQTTNKQSICGNRSLANSLVVVCAIRRFLCQEPDRRARRRPTAQPPSSGPTEVASRSATGRDAAADNRLMCVLQPQKRSVQKVKR
jgi:hypothetical protein